VCWSSVPSTVRAHTQPAAHFSCVSRHITCDVPAPSRPLQRTAATAVDAPWPSQTRGGWSAERAWPAHLARFDVPQPIPTAAGSVRCLAARSAQARGTLTRDPSPTPDGCSSSPLSHLGWRGSVQSWPRCLGCSTFYAVCHRRVVPNSPWQARCFGISFSIAHGSIRSSARIGNTRNREYILLGFTIAHARTIGEKIEQRRQWRVRTPVERLAAKPGQPTYTQLGPGLRCSGRLPAKVVEESVAEDIKWRAARRRIVPIQVH
jgi:hypothetical protein